MAFRFGSRDTEIFLWLAAARSLTGRQLGMAIDMPESSVRRRMAQGVQEGLATRSPLIEGATGQRERDYSLTAANCRKLRRVAPWIDVRPSGRTKPVSVPHRRLVNEFWVSLYVALRKQSFYTFTFLPHYDYDLSDPDAPTRIAALNSRSKTKHDITSVADFALAVSCDAGSSWSFGETDLATESLDSTLRTRPTLLRKLENYAAYHDSNKHQRLAAQFGYNLSGFRVLVVTISRRRLDNIRKLCDRIGGSSDFIWLTTVDQITPGKILGPVWITGESPTKRPLLRHYHPARRKR